MSEFKVITFDEHIFNGVRWSYKAGYRVVRDVPGTLCGYDDEGKLAPIMRREIWAEYTPDMNDDSAKARSFYVATNLCARRNEASQCGGPPAAQ